VVDPLAAYVRPREARRLSGVQKALTPPVHPFGPERVTEHFLGMNPDMLPQPARRVVTFSHFLPRIDLIPFFVPRAMRRLDPVLGSSGIEQQLRALGADLPPGLPALDPLRAAPQPGGPAGGSVG